MKKQYEAPKAELMVFDYEENVVASNLEATETITGATENTTGNPWVGETGKGKNKTGCTKLDKC